LTGDPEYAQLTQKAESYLLKPQNPALGEPFPGLLGTNVDVNTGSFIDNRGGWSGGDDSFYEYLLKMYVYDSSRFGAYRDRWITAADSTIAHLASHPSSRPDLTFLAEYDGTSLVFESQHLTCFDGGNFLLGGKVLNRQDYIDFGLALVNGCHDTYISTLTGIGPEAFSWNTTTLPADQAAFYAKSGFWIENGQYITRPEVVESYYYAYRVTGDQMYRDWAWDAFVAINATTRTGSGFSSISDVNAPGGGEKTDNQESFLFAEVLKYSYLIHAPVSDVFAFCDPGCVDGGFYLTACSRLSMRNHSIIKPCRPPFRFSNHPSITRTDTHPLLGRRLAGRTQRQERLRLQHRSAPFQSRWYTCLRIGEKRSDR